MADRPPPPQQELIDFLNGEAAKAPPLRKRHHLPDAHYSVAGGVYCLTMCARHRAEVFKDDALAKGVVASLIFYRDRRDFYLRAYCLMPDHLHVVLELRDAEKSEDNRIRRFASAFKSYTTTKIAWPSGLRGILWQRDWYDHVGRTYEDIDNQCRYVLENPVRKGLVENWLDYPFSGAPDPWCDERELFG